jgi:hypothetical protein
MGKIIEPDKVKLICGILYNNKINFQQILNVLQNKFGNIDSQTESFKFKFTDYYNKEMGDEIYRIYISFEKLILPDELSDIKIFTNNIETEFSETENRDINIDPGYIELGKLVLASTKNYSHRIYIGKGIYAEPTLQYFNKTYTKWPFSYLDYSDKLAVDFFNNVRTIYKNQLNEIQGD